MYEFREQPWRSLYLAYERFTTDFIRVPFWYLISLPRAWRPRQSWDLERCLKVKQAQRRGVAGSRVGRVGPPEPNHLAIVEGDGVKGVWIAPVPRLVVGDVAAWTEAAHVAAVPIPGYWIDSPLAQPGAASAPADGPPRAREKVVYALHGGGYSSHSGYPGDSTAHIARGIMQHCPSVMRVFSLEYRISAGPPDVTEFVNPFPAALLDALAGYNHLVNVVGFAPEDIIVEGDSAGANLALGLARYLLENQGALAKLALEGDTRALAVPGALLLNSPWTDLSMSHDIPGSSLVDFGPSDILLPLDSPGNMYSKRAFTGPHGLAFADANRYVSPSSRHPSADRVRFAGFPRTLIVAGGAERLVDQMRTLDDQMGADMARGMGRGQICYYEAADGVHDYLVFLWHEPERTETLKKISEWIDFV